MKAKYINIWGANPARCSMHSMKYIYQAREKAWGEGRGYRPAAVADQAAKADLYLRVRPCSDGATEMACVICG